MKTIIVYCSIIPHDAPPFSRFHVMRLMSRSVPVVFLDAPWQSRWTGWGGVLQYVIWMGRNLFSVQNFLVWNFSTPFAQGVLWLYLAILKRVFGYRVAMVTDMAAWYPIYQAIPFDFSCFNCTDQYSESEFRQNALAIGKHDTVFVNSDSLKKLLLPFAKSVQKVSSGYYTARSVPKVEKTKVKNSAIFLGGISRRIDYSLIDEVAQQMPDWQFFFVGEVYFYTHYLDPEADKHTFPKWQELLTLPNVQYLGAVDSQSIWSFLDMSEVGIIPYTVSDVMNYYSHPIKLYEYLESELPVVATPLMVLQEIQKHGPIYLAETPRDFVKSLKTAQKSARHSRKKESTSRFLRSHSKQNKVKQLLQWIEEMNAQR